MKDTPINFMKRKDSSDTIAIWHAFHGNRSEKYMLFISFKSYRKTLLSLRLLVAAMHREGIHIVIL